MLSQILTKTYLIFISCLILVAFFDKDAAAQDLDKAWSFFNNEEYKLAAEEFIKEKEKENEINTTYAGLCLFIATSYERNNRHDEAILYYNLCIDAYKSIPNGISEKYYSTCLSNLASLYSTLGQYDKALLLNLESLATTEKYLGKEHSSYGINLNNLAELYKTLGQYEKALPLAIEALENAEQSFGKEHSEYGIRLSNLAVLYHRQGNLTKALLLSTESIKIMEKTLGKEHPNYGISLNNLASVYMDLGEYDNVITLTIEAMENTEKSYGKDHYYYSIYLKNLALSYQSIGQFDKALALYLEAVDIQIKELGKEHSIYGSSLITLAELYRIIGRYEEAISLNIEGVGVIEKSLGKDHPQYGVGLNNLALSYMSYRQYEKALPICLDAIEVAKKNKGEGYSYYGRYINNLASIYESMQQYDQAILLYLESLAYNEKHLGKEHDTYGIILSNMADLYRTIGQYDKAMPLYDRALTIINNNIKQYLFFLNESEKKNYLNAINSFYNKFNSFALQYKAGHDSIVNYVYDISLVNKGIILKSSMAVNTVILNSEDTSLINRFNTWSLLKKQIARLYSVEKSKRNHSPVELEKEASSIESELVRLSSEFKDYNQLPNIHWRDIQTALKPNEVAVEFIHFRYYGKIPTSKTTYCALVLRHDYEYPKMVFLFEEQQLQNVISFSSNNNSHQLIANLYGQARGATMLNTFAEATYGDTLFKLIWQPLDTLLVDVSKVFYSPSGLLHNISFAAIPTSDSTLLCDNYDLALVSTTANIVLNNQPGLDVTDAAIYGGITYDMTQEEMLVSAEKYKDKTENLLAYNRGLGYNDTIRGGSWNYLNGTLPEANNVASILNVNNIDTTLYTGASANEESFKSLSGRNSPEIIHIATHGFFFPDPKKEIMNDFDFQQIGGKTFSVADNPLFRSGLIFAGGNAAWNREEIPNEIEDGILTAYEVSGLDLFNTQLVTLSACETGLGDIQGTEGVYGLQRAFKMAGVDYLIMSLWQVPDKETQEFMNLFYSNWTGGQTIGDAFRATQRSMRKKYEAYYWAGFVLLE